MQSSCVRVEPRCHRNGLDVICQKKDCCNSFFLIRLSAELAAYPPSANTTWIATGAHTVVNCPHRCRVKCRAFIAHHTTCGRKKRGSEQPQKRGPKLPTWQDLLKITKKHGDRQTKPAWPHSQVSGNILWIGFSLVLGSALKESDNLF